MTSNSENLDQSTSTDESWAGSISNKESQKKAMNTNENLIRTMSSNRSREVFRNCDESRMKRRLGRGRSSQGRTCSCSSRGGSDEFWEKLFDSKDELTNNTESQKKAMSTNENLIKKDGKSMDENESVNELQSFDLSNEKLWIDKKGRDEVSRNMKGSHAPELADLAVRKASIRQGGGGHDFTKVKVRKACYTEDDSVLRLCYSPGKLNKESRTLV